MVLLIRWWRSLLAALSFRGDESAHWVEPANDITRAILSGQPLWLPAQAETTAVGVEAPAVAVEVAAPALLPEVAAQVEVEESAAEERREVPPTRTRRRRGRRAA